MAQMMRMVRVFAVVVALGLVRIVLGAREDGHTEEVRYVSYGSVIKLEHIPTGTRLFSQDMAYGSGSSQQFTSCNPQIDDENGFWVVKSAHQEPPQAQGTPVPCGATIRLQHLTTRRNLHSHNHASPYKNYEVSCYGDDGNGDLGDNWIVECRTDDQAFWERFATVSFTHKQTGRSLQALAKNKYSDPIANHIEVSCTSKKSANTQWKTNEGIYFVPRT
ncbi:Stromal cell-derived factor 2-like protein [Porphyridium purpureum]|uniref:Stromal cell-derived factor 2-like protein n=1 Tax=Porphyridium purpureum TaxID=35688 RepID=A0A5J4Z413_PORPP|nr:Stromal cell-derived factor 2-like protein [Porphyridium purpureum]|eukprot:POR3279..scf295_1